MDAVLTPEKVSDYGRKGYLLLAGVFGAAEVAAWDAESRRLLRLGLGHEDNLRSVVYRAPGGLAVLDRYDPVIDISPVFRSLARDERILRPLRELCGGGMLLFKDKLIYKMLGVPGYEMHQDYSFWQLFPRDLVNVIVSIDAADEENGGVEFFPGYHGRLLSTQGELRRMNEAEAAQIDHGAGEVVRTGPGDLVIFDCMTPHRSGVNRSHRMRRQLYLTYSAARNGDLYQRQLDYFAGLRREKTGRASEQLFFR